MRRFVVLMILAACQDWDGYTIAEGDCNNNAPGTNPHALETCDGRDNDCDGEIDEGCDESPDIVPDTDPHTHDTDCPMVAWYHDADGDGYGGVEEFDVCEGEKPPKNYVDNRADCDDDNNATHPGAPEACDGKDNDCDGQVDDNIHETWYEDHDRDGYGSDIVLDIVCEGEHGTAVDNSRDCDDTDHRINPEAQELCDGQHTDEDCNGLADDEDPNTPDWSKFVFYHDTDGDGYGDPRTESLYCESPDDSWIGDNTDCDDRDDDRYPGNHEDCDGVDNDCDLIVPNDEIDNDGDRFVECDPREPDCDDTDPNVNPYEFEICDGKDNDCHNGIPPLETDDDGDGYNECADEDCDDTDFEQFPGNTEVCDDKDNDCDGETDERVC